MNFAYIFLAIILLFTTYQDLKHRTIHVILPILIAGISLYINIESTVLEYQDILINVGFLAVNFIGLIMYTSLKEKRFFNPIDKSLGLGDVIFFIVITPLSRLKPFILLFICGLIFSLVFYLVVRKNLKDQTIPLAGFFSIFLVINISLELLFHKSLFV